MSTILTRSQCVKAAQFCASVAYGEIEAKGWPGTDVQKKLFPMGLKKGMNTYTPRSGGTLTAGITLHFKNFCFERATTFLPGE